jgi:hypothetical protein
MLKIGIEQEFVFADESTGYLDADNTPYSVFSSIVDGLAVHQGDDSALDCKSLEQYPKRCYVEGFERHDPDGNVIETIPKGLEIRTMPHESVDDVVAEFRNTYTEVMELSRKAGLSPVLTSMHPFKSQLALDGRLDETERKVRSESRLAVARRSMLTHGLHVNVSVAGSPLSQMQSLVEKVNYYTPSLVPWSFSSPFYNGLLFDGLCARNHSRANTRSMADLDERQGIQVLEFRGFDAVSDARLLTALLNLFCGLVVEDSLQGRTAVQDPDRLKRSSLYGFSHPEFRAEGRAMLKAARPVLGERAESLDLLEDMLERNDSSSAQMKLCYADCGSIMDCISGRYNF